MAVETIIRCIGILRCPITGAALSVLSPEELEEINRSMETGSVLHRDGTPSREPLTFALGTSGRSEVYRAENSIIWLLADLALVPADTVTEAAVSGEKRIVQSFYDDFGWVKTTGGLYNDTELFADADPDLQSYQRYCNARIGRELPGGTYLADIASGAIPHPEYLEFSRGYAVRICVDFSIRALSEARAKLGDCGLYLLADITRLPLATGVIDTVISLHTIYHVPQDEQSDAIDELARVTKSGGRTVIVYSWASSPAMNACFGLRGTLGRLRRVFRRKEHSATADPSPAPVTPPQLYYSPQNRDWYERKVAVRHPVILKVWSAVSMQFQDRFFRGRSRKLAMTVVKFLEDCFPSPAGRYGQYPMFIIDKEQS